VRKDRDRSSLPRLMLLGLAFLWPAAGPAVTPSRSGSARVRSPHHQRQPRGQSLSPSGPNAAAHAERPAEERGLHGAGVPGCSSGTRAMPIAISDHRSFGSSRTSPALARLPQPCRNGPHRRRHGHGTAAHTRLMTWARRSQCMRAPERRLGRVIVAEVRSRRQPSLVHTVLGVPPRIADDDERDGGGLALT